MLFVQNIIITVTRHRKFIKSHFPPCFFIFYLKFCYLIIHSLVSSHFHYSSSKYIFIFNYFIVFLTFLNLGIISLVWVFGHIFSINNNFIPQYNTIFCWEYSSVFAFIYISCSVSISVSISSFLSNKLNSCSSVWLIVGTCSLTFTFSSFLSYYISILSSYISVLLPIWYISSELLWILSLTIWELFFQFSLLLYHFSILLHDHHFSSSLSYNFYSSYIIVSSLSYSCLSI